MTRKEKRRLFKQIKLKKVKKPTIKIKWPVKVEVACKKVAEQVKDLSGRTLTHGEALCLVKGAQLNIEGRLYRSLASGDLTRPHLKKKSIDLTEKMESITKIIKNNKLR